ncbi:restriction endonuclease subunit S [Vibrio fluvialis]|uniref:restriction endonuclease subunit S n=1 Tax=Vibrio fluvialis TaxID=676 RepID=UPI001302A8B4|nr:restriction endonuclease subunit S [Vibrio fluvialis]EKO3989420.1 restriction endonuclease subunit S [Vibrio fluvialis]
MSWDEVPLLSVCEVSTGKYDANHGVVNGSYQFYTCAEKPIRSNTYSFEGSSIILPGNGANVGLVLYFDGKFEAYQRTYVLNNFRRDVDSKYVYHHLNRYWKLRNEKAQYGSATNYIRMQNFKDYTIPLPPLDEQKRIAAILDKADAIRQKRKQAIDLADEFLRSVFLDMFGDPVTNPKGWDKKQLKSLLSSIDSGKSPKCDGLPANVGEWGVLKLSAVTSGQYLAQENKAMLSKSDVDERFEVVAGDVLFTRKNTRDLVAAVAYVFETEPRKLMPDLIFRLNIKDKCELEPLYLFSLLANKSQRSDIQQLAGGAAGSMPNISKAKLLEVEVPVPPIVLQRRFAEVVSKTRKIHQQNTESQSNSFLFFNSLSQKAFSGQL